MGHSRHGEQTTSTVTFATPFVGVPYAVNFSDECDDFTWLCKRKVEQQPLQKQHSYAIRYTVAKITWTAIGSKRTRSSLF